MCRTLQGHGHWVNTLALNTDYALRIGAYDPQALMKARPELTARKFDFCFRFIRLNLLCVEAFVRQDFEVMTDCVLCLLLGTELIVICQYMFLIIQGLYFCW